MVPGLLVVNGEVPKCACAFHPLSSVAQQSQAATTLQRLPLPPSIIEATFGDWAGR